MGVHLGAVAGVRRRGLIHPVLLFVALRNVLWRIGCPGTVLCGASRTTRSYGQRTIASPAEDDQHDVPGAYRTVGTECIQ